MTSELSSAQIAQDELRATIAHVRYPSLANLARIQGDVRLRIDAGVVTLLSGHPLLAPTAVESAKAFLCMQGETTFNLTYHFVFVETATSALTPVTVQRGNPFERAVLRIFGLKTEKVVLQYRCQDGVAPASDLKGARADFEVWVYGTGICVQTETATLIATATFRAEPSPKAGIRP